MTQKIAALAPMPSASVTTAVSVNAGLFASARTACLRSLMRRLDVKTHGKVVLPELFGAKVCRTRTFPSRSPAARHPPSLSPWPGWWPENRRVVVVEGTEEIESPVVNPAREVFLGHP